MKPAKELHGALRLATPDERNAAEATGVVLSLSQCKPNLLLRKEDISEPPSNAKTFSHNKWKPLQG